MSVGFISYKINNSYALFSDEVTGTKTIEVQASFDYDKTFDYTGNVQTYTIPKTGYYYIEMAGASGGTTSEVYSGRPGSKTSGYIYLEINRKLYFYVGGKGITSESGKGASGGYNGGGISAGYTGLKTTSGGGATDVRLVNGNWNDTSSLISRIMVAAGGAGGTGNSTDYNLLSGDAGGLNGANGYTTSTSYNTSTYPSSGATQIAGGVGYSGRSGEFGSAYTGSLTGYGSGGGGGYYGGAMGFGRAGSGGSSYISGYAGVNSVENNTTIIHTNDTLHYSGKYFIGGQMTNEIDEGNIGNGYAKISYVGDKPKRKNTKLNNVRYIKDCSNYNSSNNGNHWIEIEAIKNGTNIAKGKTVTGTTSQSSTYPYSRITDGDITYSNYATPTTFASNQCVTVDLGQTYDLDEVAVWNYFGDNRVYQDSETLVSSDNTNFTSIINEDTIQTSNGRRINAYTENYNGYVPNDLMLWYDGYANTGGTRSLSTTTWKNLSSSNLNGTLKNSPTWYNNYLLFNGTNNWVSIAQMNYSTPTVEVIYKKSSYTNAEEVLVGNFNDGGYGIRVANKKVGSHMYIENKWYDTTKDSSTDKIELVSATYDTNKINLYSNGTLVNTTEITGNIVTATNNTLMALGVNPYGSSYDSNSFYKGNIYSVRIYNRALTKEEISHNYNYDKQRFNLE